MSRNIPLSNPDEKPARRKSEPKLLEGTARVLIPKTAHRKLKVHCASKGIDMKDYITELLAKAGFS